MMPAIPNLLRPDQIQETKEEVTRIERTLQQPHVQDPSELLRQRSRLNQTLQDLTPKPFEGIEKDMAVKRANDLLSEMLNGMPTQAEMRRCPPGSIDKHMKWEKRNKQKVMEWKNLQLRLNAGSGDREVANLERFRPQGGAGELNLGDGLIQGKIISFGGEPVPGSIATDLELVTLRRISPDLADMLAVLTNEQRADMLGKVREVIAQEAEKKIDEVRVRAGG